MMKDELRNIIGRLSLVGVSGMAYGFTEERRVKEKRAKTKDVGSVSISLILRS